MKTILFIYFSALLSIPSYSFNPITKDQEKYKNPKETSSPKTVVKKEEVPILCYHRIRNILATDGPNMKTYSVTPEAFAQQMKALHDNGYHSISPDQLYEYTVHNASLPSKPVMITFDDTREEQYRLGTAEMKKYGFKGVFFIMTVSINRPGYMTESQIKNLSDNGHTIGAHTWDHHLVTKLEGKDWDIQLTKPKTRLEKITAKPVYYFAYPSGIWNKKAISMLKNSNYRMAFILSTKADPEESLFTVRRIIVSGSLSSSGMLKMMQSSFNKQH